MSRRISFRIRCFQPGTAPSPRPYNLVTGSGFDRPKPDHDSVKTRSRSHSGTSALIVVEEADMNPIRRLALPALLVFACAATPATADTDKEARGIITSIGHDSIMINLPNDIDVVFRVDPNTHIVARGAGKRMRRAQEEGAAGIKLGDVRSVLPIGV